MEWIIGAIHLYWMRAPIVLFAINEGVHVREEIHDVLQQRRSRVARRVAPVHIRERQARREARGDGGPLQKRVQVFRRSNREQFAHPSHVRAHQTRVRGDEPLNGADRKRADDAFRLEACETIIFGMQMHVLRLREGVEEDVGVGCGVLGDVFHGLEKVEEAARLALRHVIDRLVAFLVVDALEHLRQDGSRVGRDIRFEGNEARAGAGGDDAVAAENELANIRRKRRERSLSARGVGRVLLRRDDRAHRALGVLHLQRVLLRHEASVVSVVLPPTIFKSRLDKRGRCGGDVAVLHGERASHGGARAEHRPPGRARRRGVGDVGGRARAQHGVDQEVEDVHADVAQFPSR